MKLLQLSVVITFYCKVNHFVPFIDAYLRSACVDLANDLTACYTCLLEHNEEASRRGACRALAILQVVKLPKTMFLIITF